MAKILPLAKILISNFKINPIRMKQLKHLHGFLTAGSVEGLGRFPVSSTVMCCWAGDLSQCPGAKLCPAGRVSGDGTGTNTQTAGPRPGHSLLLRVPRGPSAELLTVFSVGGGPRPRRPVDAPRLSTTTTSSPSRPAGRCHSGDTAHDTAPDIATPPRRPLERWRRCPQPRWRRGGRGDVGGALSGAGQ